MIHVLESDSKREMISYLSCLNNNNNKNNFLNSAVEIRVLSVL